MVERVSVTPTYKSRTLVEKANSGNCLTSKGQFIGVVIEECQTRLVEFLRN